METALNALCEKFPWVGRNNIRWIAEFRECSIETMDEYDIFKSFADGMWEAGNGVMWAKLVDWFDAAEFEKMQEEARAYIKGVTGLPVPDDVMARFMIHLKEDIGDYLADQC